MELNEYLDTVESAANLAEKIGVTEGFVSQWRTGVRRVPAERCIDVERVTGGLVRCEDLRPDLDWHVVRRNCSKMPKVA